MLQDLFDSITNLPYEYMGVRDLFHDGTVQTDGIFRKEGLPVFLFFPSSLSQGHAGVMNSSYKCASMTNKREKKEKEIPRLKSY